MVREEWLRYAVEMLDADLFKGGLDLLANNYQIACGWTKRNKVSEVIFPYDGADVLETATELVEDLKLASQS